MQILHINKALSLLKDPFIITFRFFTIRTVYRVSGHVFYVFVRLFSLDNNITICLNCTVN